MARAAKRHGVVSRVDLGEVGVDRSLRRRLLAAGTLIPTGSQTWRIAGAPRTVDQQVAVACLEVGGLASHVSAASLHGLPGFRPPRTPQVTVHGRSCGYRGAGVEVHTTRWLPRDDRVVVRGIPCLGVARTLFSLAAIVPRVPVEGVRGAVDDAVRLGLASDAWLWWRLEQVRRQGRNGVSMFEEILVRRTGGKATESWLERAFLEVIDVAGLPTPICQERIRANGAFVARVDFRFPGSPVVAEVSGHVHHASEAQLARDARRRNELQMAGLVVLEFTYDDVVSRPHQVVRQVGAALAAVAA